MEDKLIFATYKLVEDIKNSGNYLEFLHNQKILFEENQAIYLEYLKEKEYYYNLDVKDVKSQEKYQNIKIKYQNLSNYKKLKASYDIINNNLIEMLKDISSTISDNIVIKEFY
ncbi:MAG: hypothetical protein LBV58_03525 [Acholeplasmatales bacterium]|jgi:hypothetical protein|nr:hypothetical protein [Acholeplasmatales bacterium]